MGVGSFLAKAGARVGMGALTGAEVGEVGGPAGAGIGAAIGTAASVAGLVADAFPLVRDLFSSPTVDQGKIDKLKAMRDNAASRLSGEMGISFDKAQEMVDQEFKPMIEEASQPQGGADASTIAGDVGALALGATATYGMSRLGKRGATAKANAAKDSSGVIAAAEQSAETGIGAKAQGPTDFRGAYDAGAYDSVKGIPDPAQMSAPPNAGGMREYPGATSERGLMVQPPAPNAGKFTMADSYNQTGPINGEPVDPETAAAARLLMQQRPSQQPPGAFRPSPANIGMDGMTPQLAQMIQERQDMLRSRGTPQGMQQRMYANAGD